jgi:oligopeptide/dipeptide ABC transporter ATP-binding protein
LQAELGLTYLFVAHNLGVVEYVSTRIGVMYLGKMVELAPRSEVFRRPLHPYTKALSAAVPVPRPTATRERIVLQGDVPSPANPPKGCRFHTRCWMAKDICRTQEPALEEKVPGRWSACHFWDQV